MPPHVRRVNRRVPVRFLSVAALPALLLHGALLGGLPHREVGALLVVSPAPMPLPAVRIRAIESNRPDQAAQQASPQPVDPAVVALQQPVHAPAVARVSARPIAGPDLVPARLRVDQPAGAPVAVVAEAENPALDDRAVAGVLMASSAESVETSAPGDSDPPQLMARNDSPAGAANRADVLVETVTDADGVAVPVYPTAPAPSQVLRYQLQRGLLSGTGELSWRHDPVNQLGARYQMQLLAKVGGLSIITQISSGGFDKAGLAPTRFTDQRLRGSVRAANFQRQRGVISFSGPTTEYPLVRGAQDRLSWMMQLPAILAANPRLAEPGQQVTLYVVGARGDASAWVFRTDAVERVATDAGPISAVKLVRDPGKEHDTLAEVWLDPARHYLPLRARIGNPDDGPMLELLRIQD